MKHYSKSAIYLTISEIAVKACLFLSNIYLARTLGSEIFGMITYGFSFLLYPTMFGNMGIDILGHLESGKDTTKFSLGHVFSAKLINSLLVLILTISGILIFIDQGVLQTLLILFSLNLFSEGLYLEWYFKGKRAFSIVSVIKFAAYLIYLILIFYFVKSGSDLLTVPILFTLANLLVSIFLLIISKRYDFRFSFRMTFDIYKRIISSSFLLGAGNILARLTPALPPIIIVSLTNFSSAGYFGAAFRIVGLLLILDRVFINIYLSYLPNLWDSNRAKMERVLQDSFNLALGMGLILSFFISVTSSHIIHLIYGLKYENSIVMLMILSWFFLLTMINSVFIVGMMSAGLKALYFKVSLLAFIVNAVSIYLMTLIFDTLGACLGVLIGETLFILLIYLGFRRHIRIKILSQIIKSIGIITFGYILYFYLPSHLYLNVTFSVISVSLLSFVSKIFDMNFLLKMVKKNES